MSKQDGVYARTAASLEQKHNYGKRFAEVLKIADDTRTRVNSMESSIATIIKTADKDRAAIKLLVEYDSEDNPTASGSFIIEAINGESSAKIKADRLDIDGKQLNIKVDAANIIGTFTVKETDATLFSAGNGAVKIGSWNVNNNSLWTGTSFSASDSIFLSTGSGDLSIAGSPAQANWVFKAGPNFGVTKNGEVYCSKAHIKRECVLGEDITTSEGMQIGPDYVVDGKDIRTRLVLIESTVEHMGTTTKGVAFETRDRISDEEAYLSNIESNNYGASVRMYKETYNSRGELDGIDKVGGVSAGRYSTRLEFANVYLEIDEQGVRCGNGSNETYLWRNS